MLCNKQTIAMSNVWFREYLAHTTDRITLWGSWLHWHTMNQTCPQLSFYSCPAE